MANRDDLGRSLAETLRIRDRALTRGKEESYIRELDDQLESLRANIDYVQENIAECQRNIVQIEEAKVILNNFFFTGLDRFHRDFDDLEPGEFMANVGETRFYNFKIEFSPNFSQHFLVLPQFFPDFNNLKLSN